MCSGRWRTEDAGKPIDAKGELPDGTTFEGPDQLKAALMQERTCSSATCTNKVLGYALGRGLTLQDSCTVDSIVAEVERNNYSAQALINAVVMSVPFRYQASAGRCAGPKQLRELRRQQEKKSMMIPARKRCPAEPSCEAPASPLGLPWLEAMVPSALADSRPANARSPVRMAVLYMPNGVNTSQWTPEGQGRDFRLSPTLQSLQDLKDQLLVVSNLWNAAANTGDGHYAKESSLLTCTTITKTLGVDINIHGPSMDQVAAQRVGEQTPLPSLELGDRARSPRAWMPMSDIRECTAATSRGAVRPLRSRARPIRGPCMHVCSGRRVRPAIRSKQDTLLLDRVLDHSRKMRCKARRRRSGPDGRVPGDRPIARDADGARRPIRSGTHGSRWCRSRPAPKPTGNPATHEEHVRLMLDLIALAFQSDTTRITTFMFGNAVSGVNFRFLEGVTDSHHEISHHSKDRRETARNTL